MLVSDLVCALDASEFMRSVGCIIPDPWQVDFLRGNDRRVLLNCSRQAGKSTVTSFLALHEAIYNPGALVLLVSPSQRQSAELYLKVVENFVAMGNRQNDNALSTVLEFSNGSRIVTLPGSERTIRGFSGVDLVIMDEAARVEDALYHAVSPMLAVSGGRLIMLSSPFGQRGIFFEQWRNGGDAWKRYEIPADKCPRITREFLEGERRVLPDRVFRQEYFCEFLQTDDAVFAYEDVMAAVSSDIEPLFAGENEGVCIFSDLI